jgi:hypothetical protein
LASAFTADSVSEQDGSRLIRDIAQGSTPQDTHSSDSYLGRIANAINGNPTASTDPARDGQTVPQLAAGDAPAQLAQGLGLDLSTIATALIVTGAVIGGLFAAKLLLGR